MPESTLALTIDNLRSEAALVMGYNSTYASCTSAQQGEIDRAVSSGYRQFLYPPQAPDPEDPRRLVTHQWSFLKVVSATLSVVSPTTTYVLPDTFGHIIGHDMTIEAGAELYSPIEVTGEAELRRLRQTESDTVGVPRYVAIRPKAFTGATTGERFEAIFWPIPDASRTVTYSYAPIANAMVTSTSPYPWGGAAHAETLKASVRAEAELVRFRVRAVEWQRFMERLVASIKEDRSHGARILGQNSDESDGVPSVQRRYGYTVTPPS